MNYGEIWQLGRHRLMCGDATKAEDIAKLMQSDHARMLFTSPPYGAIRDYMGHDMSIEHIVNFIPAAKDFVDVMCVNLGILRKDWEIIQYWDSYIAKAKECGLKLLSWNIWDKGSAGSIYAQKAMFPIRHEFIFVFGEKAYKLNRTIPKLEPILSNRELLRTRRQTDGSVVKTSAHSYLDEPNKPMETVIKINAEKRPICRQHPAVMPVELPKEYIKACTQEGDTILDCFGGSGTTLIACEVTNRNCLIMEISPEYCEIIKSRWEKLNPLFNQNKAERIA